MTSGETERIDWERIRHLLKVVPVPDRIQNAYHDSKNIYDDVLTQGSFLSRQYIRFFCSVDMLDQAKKRLEDCKHISFVQGDVGDLPLADGSQDIVMSMNGFHAFPNKKKAFKETFRVLKKGGMFVACFYIKGKSKRTDCLVKNILSKKGWFTPPFPTEEQLLRILHIFTSRWDDSNNVNEVCR